VSELQEREEKKATCPDCGNECKEIVTKEITLLDFGGGPVPSVQVKDRKIVCTNCLDESVGGIKNWIKREDD
jgi:hypothetical protein